MRTDFARIYILCPYTSAYPNGVHSQQDYYQMLRQCIFWSLQAGSAGFAGSASSGPIKQLQPELPAEYVSSHTLAHAHWQTSFQTRGLPGHHQVQKQRPTPLPCMLNFTKYKLLLVENSRDQNLLDPCPIATHHRDCLCRVWAHICRNTYF